MKTKPSAGVAVSTSAVYAGYLAEQPVDAGTPSVMTQLMAGTSPAWLVTLPLPAPTVPLPILTVKGPWRKRARAVRFAVMGARQVPVPVQ